MVQSPCSDAAVAVAVARAAGLSLRVMRTEPRAEHLIAMKMQALRNDPSRELQDLADIQYLLGLSDTNREAARGYFERAGLTEWYDKLIKRL